MKLLKEFLIIGFCIFATTLAQVKHGHEHKPEPGHGLLVNSEQPVNLGKPINRFKAVGETITPATRDHRIPIQNRESVPAVHVPVQQGVNRFPAISRTERIPNQALSQPRSINHLPTLSRNGQLPIHPVVQENNRFNSTRERSPGDNRFPAISKTNRFPTFLNRDSLPAVRVPDQQRMINRLTTLSRNGQLPIRPVVQENNRFNSTRERSPALNRDRGQGQVLNTNIQQVFNREGLPILDRDGQPIYLNSEGLPVSNRDGRLAADRINQQSFNGNDRQVRDRDGRQRFNAVDQPFIDRRGLPAVNREGRQLFNRGGGRTVRTNDRLVPNTIRGRRVNPRDSLGRTNRRIPDGRVIPRFPAGDFDPRFAPSRFPDGRVDPRLSNSRFPVGGDVPRIADRFSGRFQGRNVQPNLARGQGRCCEFRMMPRTVCGNGQNRCTVVRQRECVALCETRRQG